MNIFLLVILTTAVAAIGITVSLLFSQRQAERDRAISIIDGIVTIKDFSKDCELEAYTSWGEKNYGTKVQFSEGYKRIN